MRVTAAVPSARELGGLVDLRGRSLWRIRAALVLTAVTVAVEVGALAGWIPDLAVGRIVVSASAVPAAALVLLIGRGLLGHSRQRHPALAYWCVVTAVIVVAALSFGHLADLAGLVAATADEELVYRLAVPAMVAALLLAAGVARRHARVLGFAAGAVWFICLPGHRAQWSSPLTIAAFAAFATVTALVVYRSGSVGATFLAHLSADLLTMLVWNDLAPREERGLLLAAVLVLLVVAYGTPGRRARGGTRSRRRGASELVVDLRDGHVPSLQRGGGPPVPIVAQPEPEAVGGSDGALAEPSAPGVGAGAGDAGARGAGAVDAGHAPRGTAR